MTITRAVDISAMIDRRVTETSVSSEDQGVAPHIASLAVDKMITTRETIGSAASSPDVLHPSVSQTAAEWALAQWGGVGLGDERLDHRAVRVGAAMATNPAQSLPQQMDGDRAALDGAY